MIQELRLGEELNWDWLILLIAKTGIRFSEALALTTQDFDFHRQLLTIDKTWNYKGDGGFLPTKINLQFEKSNSTGKPAPNSPTYYSTPNLMTYFS